jgi:hypothetical protein
MKEFIAKLNDKLEKKMNKNMASDDLEKCKEDVCQLRT